MQITLNVDDALFTQAAAFIGVEERSALVQEALRALIQRESARQLASLGGSEPKLKPSPRRRLK